MQGQGAAQSESVVWLDFMVGFAINKLCDFEQTI